MRVKQTLVSVGIATALATSVIGCTQGSYGTSHGIKDAPINTKGTDNSPATIINFPDGYENVAFKCHGLVGVYTTTRVAAPVVVLNDPNCR